MLDRTLSSYEQIENKLNVLKTINLIDLFNKFEDVLLKTFYPNADEHESAIEISK